MSVWSRMHQFKRSEFANDGGCSVCGQQEDTAQHRANGQPEFRYGGVVVRINKIDAQAVLEAMKKRGLGGTR
jgi:hypothetical protein